MAALRSRVLAVVLIISVSTFSLMITFVPQGDLSDPEVSAWVGSHPTLGSVTGSLGLHHAYRGFPFLMMSLLLAASTVACAWERMRRAMRIWRSLKIAGDEFAARKLVERPQATVRIPSDVESEHAVAVTIGALRGLGLRVRMDDGLLTGASGTLALMASPLFHYSIALFILAVLIGQATGSAGFMALPLREKITENHENYLQISEGPYFRERHTGVTLELLELRRNYTSKGVDYGVVPRIRATRDGAEIASGYVHANRPMRIGSLMLHAFDYGPTAILAIESSGGAEVGRRIFFLDRSDETSSGTLSQEFTVRGEPGRDPYQLRVQVVIRGASAAAGKVILEAVSTPQGAYGAPQMLGEGEFVRLPDGYRLRVAKVSDWSRVRVANDRSLIVVYALMTLMTLWLALAILVPTRCVRALVSPSGTQLCISVWHSRRDAQFLQRIVGALEDALTE